MRSLGLFKVSSEDFLSVGRHSLLDEPGFIDEALAGHTRAVEAV